MEGADRSKNIMGVLDETLKRITEQAALYLRRAAWERRLHTTFSATLAILGVAAPTLVAYDFQTPPSTIKFVAIAMTAITGAAGTLQATFRWSDRYRRTSLTALALAELESSTRMALYDMSDTDGAMSVDKAYKLNESAQQELQKIIRRHIEGEVAIVTHSMQSNSKKLKNPG